MALKASYIIVDELFVSSNFSSNFSILWKWKLCAFQTKCLVRFQSFAFSHGSFEASAHGSSVCGWTVQPPMASQDSAPDNLNPRMEGSTSSSSGLSCPVHTPGSEDTNRGFRKGIQRHNDYVKISVPDPKGNCLPMEWWKTVIAFFYAGFNLILTTVVITVVHERVPPKESSPPLPDKFFDYVDRVNWAFTVTEINGMVLLVIWIIQMFFFRYK